MEIDLAIKKLNEFKKLSKHLGECDLIGFDNKSFTIKVQFDEEQTQDTEYKPVLGFAEITRAKKKEDKKTI